MSLPIFQDISYSQLLVPTNRKRGRHLSGGLSESCTAPAIHLAVPETAPAGQSGRTQVTHLDASHMLHPYPAQFEVVQLLVFPTNHIAVVKCERWRLSSHSLNLQIRMVG